MSHSIYKVCSVKIVAPYTLQVRFDDRTRSEEHTSELQSRLHLVCRLLLEKKNTNNTATTTGPTSVALKRYHLPAIASPAQTGSPYRPSGSSPIVKPLIAPHRDAPYSTSPM